MTTKRVKICHFSDLHLVPGQPVSWWALINKRALGYANLRFNRGKTHRPENLSILLESVVKERADWVVVTGDFTSLALDFEFDTIHRLFKEAGLSPENTVIIPGNHDRYTIRADLSSAFEKGLGEWIPDGFSKKSGYPIVIDADPVCLIGMDTAVWQNPVSAAGAISRPQLARLKHALSPMQLNGRWPVIAMHHPPFHRGNRQLMHYRTGLKGYSRFIDAVTTQATVLHGHMHVFSRIRTEYLDIIGVSSASNDTGKEETQLAYHTYVFDNSGMVSAECNRFWPVGGGDFRTERTPIPTAV